MTIFFFQLYYLCRCGVEQQVARRAHNPKVAGSNPAPATTHGGKMSLLNEIDTRLVQARRDRNTAVADCLKIVKTRLSVKKSEKGFSGELTDEIVLQTIAGYVKEVKKALEEMEKGGAGDTEIAEKYRFEIEYLSEFLPKLMDREQTVEVVKAVIQQTGALTKRDKGRVMSTLMKEYKGRIDPKMAGGICDELLS